MIRKKKQRDQDIESLVAKAKSMGISSGDLEPAVHNLLEKLAIHGLDKTASRALVAMEEAMNKKGLTLQISYIYDTVGRAQTESVLNHLNALDTFVRRVYAKEDK